MTNVSLGEVTELRDFLTTAQTHLRTIERAIEPDDGNQQQDNSNQFTYTFREQNASATVDTPSHSRANADISLNNDNMDQF
jgi:hypothetical protein